MLHLDSLWAKLIHTKYHFMGSWHDYQQLRHRSAIWSKICSFGPSVRPHFIWEIGSGDSIDIFFKTRGSPGLLSVGGLHSLMVDITNMQLKLSGFYYLRKGSWIGLG